MQSKLIAGIVLVIALVGLGIWVSSPDNTNNQLTIGVTAPQTGDLAFLGESYVKAINLAAKEIRSEYPELKLNIIFEDDGFDPAKGVSAVRKLMDINKANVIFSFGSPVGNAVSPVAESAQIPHINSIASDPNVANGKWNFVHWTPPYKESVLMASELKKRGITRVVLIEQNQPGVLAVTKFLRQELPKAGVEIVASEKFNGDTTDFRSMIAKVKNTEADLYILEATSPTLEILARQLRQGGVNKDFTSVEVFEFTEDAKLFEGSWYVNAADQSEKFITKYQAEYGEMPKLGAGNGYDSVKLIAKIVAEHGSNGETIRQELGKIRNYSGAMGILSVDQDGIVVSDAVVRVIKDGKPMTIK